MRAGPGVPVGARRATAADASLTEIDGRPVSLFRLDGGKHRGAIGSAEGEVLARAVQLATDLRIPVVGVVATSGADVEEGVAALHAWGGVARALASASGVVPTVLVVIGPAVSGPALLLGLADVVVLTRDAFAYVTAPDTITAFTGVPIDRDSLGGIAVHQRRSGVASLVVDDEDHAMEAVHDVLSFLPGSNLDDPPRLRSIDPVGRPCDDAARAVPGRANAAYDVRTVVADILDEASFLELRPGYAANLVTGFGRLDGRVVGIVANQPAVRAGTIDVEASEKGARFVQWCDTFNIPLLTVVDTPGFEPGRDLEWRGMIRHGAELVHAYAAATVPRLSVVIRKAYGGAYIVMDSKTLGSDWCAAWPASEIAVVGATGAVEILHGRNLAAIDDFDARTAQLAALEVEYAGNLLNPYRAAERGLIDEVVTPAETRRALARALDQLVTKREMANPRRHANSPL
ncbi:MAG: acyl-CoA carboxylase subunit beta [Acidimicrobiia bacterium]